jgi:hypothetical protein
MFSIWDCFAHNKQKLTFTVLCQLTNPVQEQVDNAPVRSLNRRDEIEDVLSGIDMSDMPEKGEPIPEKGEPIPEKGEPIPARPSKRDTVTPSADDVSEAGPEVYQETYNMKPEVTEVTEESYDDVLPELSDSLSKRGLFDDLSLDKTLPEFEDSYEETVPEVTSAAYEGVPEVTSAAYQAKPTPVEAAYGALPTPSDVYEAAPTPSEVYNAAPVKPSKVYVPTPTKEPTYGALPTPVKDTYEAAPIEDSYDSLGDSLDFDLGFRKN